MLNFEMPSRQMISPFSITTSRNYIYIYMFIYQTIRYRFLRNLLYSTTELYCIFLATVAFCYCGERYNNIIQKLVMYGTMDCFSFSSTPFSYEWSQDGGSGTIRNPPKAAYVYSEDPAETRTYDQAS